MHDSDGGIALRGFHASLPDDSQGSDPRHFDATVPRQYVHRAAVSEVLLTGWTRGATSTHTVFAQWPRAHSLYFPIAGRWQDPLLIAESFRQAGLLIAHTEFGVPLGHRFIMRDLSYATRADALRVSPRPTDLEISVACHDTVWRGARLSGMRCDFTLLTGGTLTATGQAGFNCVSPAVYQRMRSATADQAAAATAPAPAPAPERPALVGRTSAANVVLAHGTGGRRQLRIDRTHPVLFDHPTDHVPGMVLLEAVRQATQSLYFPTCALPVDIACQFHRYVEFDTPCWITVDDNDAIRSDHRRAHVSAVQNDTVAFDCDVVVNCSTMLRHRTPRARRPATRILTAA